MHAHSDRDLLTQQVSPVSGTTAYTYDEHGELATTTDARTIVTTRTVDVLDRVTAVSYSDGTPGTGYAYDVGAFGKGRLSSITRSGQTISYSYDRFGRLTQDGALAYGYDVNGNRTRMSYPNNVAAVYTHDFADREATLAYEQSGGSQAPAIVTSAAYEPFGPLASLTLGNGLTETRVFDARYFSDSIQVPGRLDWDYTVDAVGNPLQIADVLTPAQSRTYGYQDPQYFLTQGNGPWGTRSWTYDRIGNRLTETRGALTDTYGYTGGNPKLQTVTLPSGAGTKYFAYDATGNQVQDSRPDSELQLTYDAAGRLTRLGEVATDTAARLVYDGRGFLRESRQDLSVCAPLLTQATYTSEGVLVHRAQRNALAPAAPPLDEAYVFYFAGRPVAILRGNVPATLTRTYLTADHLGTPVLATSAAGVTVWAGGFEPFGEDWSGAEGAGVFLRFPGQWEDASWAGGGLESGLYYNVHRWYATDKGRYSTPDPVDLGVLMNPVAPGGLDNLEAFLQASIRAGNPKFENRYGYGANQPLVFIDPDGRVVPLVCALPVAVPAFVKAVVVTVTAVSAAVSGVVVADWWNRRRDCDKCGRDKPSDDYCKRMRLVCIAQCTEETIPTGTRDGAPFFECVTRCLASVGCGNYWK